MVRKNRVDWLLRSRVLKSTLRVQVGFKAVGCWLMDWIYPRGIVIHLFELLLWWRERRGGRTQESLSQWLQNRGYLHPEERELRQAHGWRWPLVQVKQAIRPRSKRS